MGESKGLDNKVYWMKWICYMSLENDVSNAIQQVKYAKVDFVQKSQREYYYLHILKIGCFDHENWDVVLNCLSRSGWMMWQRWDLVDKNGSLTNWWFKEHWNGLVWLITFWAADGLMSKIGCNNGWNRIRLHWYGLNGSILLWVNWNKWVYDGKIWYIVGYWIRCIWYGLGYSMTCWAAFVIKLFEGFKWHFFLGRLWSRKISLVTFYLVFYLIVLCFFLRDVLPWPKSLGNSLP
ncbi:hypothetical protein QVD17_21307 [Tagetes erecta]|uniref:Transmembrane protein n=1 Tax=Tagetes erecta TaxID=13708 RepID=A0AAD8NYT6_TARER|nr:hypothetical protein QVD17_21307 [Tagetes erecta]